MTTDEQKRWTPVEQPNGVYCSPGCGFNCTKEDFNEATRKGKELAERMGQKWYPRIWENCKWHYEAKVEFGDHEVTIHPGHPYGNARMPHREGIDEYTCYLNACTQVIVKDVDPRKAFDKALAEFKAFTKAAVATVNVLEIV